MDPPSPSKRPRVDEGDEMEWDPNKTPIANRIGRVTGAPSLPPPVPVFDQTSPTSSRAGSSYPSDSSKVRRSKSPVKNAASLDHLAKPVRFITLAPNAVPQLPEDAHELYTKVRDILADHEQILPIEIRPELEDITGRKLGSHWFKQGGQGGSEQQGKSGESTASGQGGSGSKQEEGINASYKEGRRQRERGREARQICLDELDKFVDIQAAADDCQLQSRHELAWNMLVHLPLLQHIFSGNARHIIEPVTSVTIAQAFVPRWSNNKAADNAVGDAVNSKKVDFVVKLNPASDILNAAIHKAVSLQPVGIDTVNQTTYASLRYHPIALTIETKTSTGSREEANIQLAIWTAAWYRRLQSLSLAPLRMITLPLLLVVEHDWRLYFAVDRGDSIVSLMTKHVLCCRIWH